MAWAAFPIHIFECVTGYSCFIAPDMDAFTHHTTSLARVLVERGGVGDKFKAFGAVWKVGTERRVAETFTSDRAATVVLLCHCKYMWIA